MFFVSVLETGAPLNVSWNVNGSAAYAYNVPLNTSIQLIWTDHMYHDVQNSSNVTVGDCEKYFGNASNPRVCTFIPVLATQVYHCSQHAMTLNIIGKFPHAHHR